MYIPKSQGEDVLLDSQHPIGNRKAKAQKQDNSKPPRSTQGQSICCFNKVIDS